LLALRNATLTFTFRAEVTLPNSGSFAGFSTGLESLLGGDRSCSRRVHHWFLQVRPQVNILQLNNSLRSAHMSFGSQRLIAFLRSLADKAHRHGTTSKSKKNGCAKKRGQTRPGGPALKTMFFVKHYLVGDQNLFGRDGPSASSTSFFGVLGAGYASLTPRSAR
jgi:hypothetical protein